MEDGCEDGCGILFGVLSVGGDVCVEPSSLCSFFKDRDKKRTKERR